MQYYELLGLTREPFSNSPDPGFFYNSQSHSWCLQQMEEAIRQRMGLFICLGKVGAGKSTLCRTLMQRLDQDARIATHPILDPSFSREQEFLSCLYSRFLGTRPSDLNVADELLKALIDHLAHGAQEDSSVLTLLVDEGQKLSHKCMELLKKLLEVDAANSNRLQVVIFAQEEFSLVAASVPGFQQKIGQTCLLKPLGFLETRALIRHRLQLAGARSDLFSLPAYWTMHRFTQGRPRRIMHLGHHVLLSLIKNHRNKANRGTVLACALEMTGRPGRIPVKLHKAFAAGLFCATVLFPAALDDVHRDGPANWTIVDAGTPGTFTASEYRGRITRIHETPLGPGPNDGLPKQSTQAPKALTTNANKTARTPETQFFVQTGAFQVLEYAEQSLEQLRRTYPEAGMMVVEHDAKSWFVVYLDSFDEPVPAAQAANEFRRKHGRQAALVQVKDGAYLAVSWTGAAP